MRASAKANQFSESVIREMTRLALAHDAVNLAQGFPDFAAPQAIKDAAATAINADINQYAITWGARSIREALAEKTRWHLHVDIDPDTEVTVCCGATEGMIDVLLAVVDPGDEVVIFEPFYENYGPDAIICGAVPRYVPLHPPDWHIDFDQLAAAFSDRTKAVILNTPHNPTGKAFNADEIAAIGALCERHDALIVTDEIYEHIIYTGEPHRSPIQHPDLRHRTAVVNSMSKTYSVTGWRVGWVIAPPHITSAIRKMHDFITVGAAAPLQEAGAMALRLDPDYYATLAADYRQRRDRMLAALDSLPFQAFKPDGAYYVMADISAFGFPDDVTFARRLVSDIGVATVPGSSFYSSSEGGRQMIRFCFCKRDSTLDAAAKRLSRVRDLQAAPTTEGSSTEGNLEGIVPASSDSRGQVVGGGLSGTIQ